MASPENIALDRAILELPTAVKKIKTWDIHTNRTLSTINKIQLIAIYNLAYPDDSRYPKVVDKAIKNYRTGKGINIPEDKINGIEEVVFIKALQEIDEWKNRSTRRTAAG